MSEKTINIPFAIINHLHSVVTAHGNVLRGAVEVAGRQFRVESDGREWVNIISDDSRCEACVIDAEGDVLSESGECVTQSWTQGDWTQLTAFVGVTIGTRLCGSLV